MKTNKSLLAALPLVVAPLYAYGKAHKTQAPNIIFILCDDMGYGDLACYGQPYIQLQTSTAWRQRACASLRHTPVRRCRHRHVPL